MSRMLRRNHGSLVVPRRDRGRVALAAALALALLGARPAHALPDITPEILEPEILENATVDPGDVVEGCAGSETGRRLLSFSLRTRSLGPDDLVLGDPACPDCSTNPGAVCGNPLFVCSEAHGHPHFEGFAAADLLDENGVVVATGHKQGFCLLDLECPNPQFDCGFQGISVGCSDVYAAGLPCQYIDLTDTTLPDGDYTLRVTLDDEDAITEADESNNVTTAPIHIGAPTPPAPPRCPVVTATDLPTPIPDLGVATSTVVVTRPGTVLSVRVVDLAGTHTYTGDLRVLLTSPSGTEVTLFQNICGDAQNFDLDLADASYASDPIPCPLTGGGLYVAAALADFIGETAAGNWTLTVRDTLAQDSGQLARFGLEVCTTCGDGTLGVGEICDDGNSVSGDCCTADCQTAAIDGTACSVTEECIPNGSCSAGACAGAVECDPCLTCQPPLGCMPPTNVLCDSEPARSSRVKLIDDATRPDRDRLTWSWTSGYPVAQLDFGNPSQVTDLTLCVFDQTGLKLSATAPAAGTCHGKNCWSTAGGNVKYSDRDLTPDGLLKIQAKPGDPGKAKITVKGKGENLGLSPLGLSGTVTVRLKRSGGPACWQAKFPTATRNEPGMYKATIRP